MTTLRDFHVTALDGTDVDLGQYDGQVVVVVNTASHGRFTHQLKALQEMYEVFGPRGFTVLGFPCDQFGQQHDGVDEIREGRARYGVTFPIFDKVAVNGPDAHPLWQWLRREGSGVLDDRIKWNFCKFLVGTDGHVVRRFASAISPYALANDIEARLPR